MKKLLGIVAALFIGLAAYAGPPQPAGSVGKPPKAKEAVTKDTKPKAQNKFKSKKQVRVKNSILKKGWLKNPHNPHHPKSDNPGKGKK